MDYKEFNEDLKGQALSQPGNTYLKLTTETLEKGVKYVQGKKLKRHTIKSFYC